MCGLTAIFSYGVDAPPIDRDELNSISDYMWARGPDGEGQWISGDDKVGFAHKRLAIIDISDNAAQPMALLGENGQDRLVITYNGEIYNFKSLRDELIAQGHRFKSISDTEVLLHLYDRYGDAMLDRLRGMYAFAIWDANRQGLFLARDPFGIKPLYYADDGGTIRVASQVKALLAGGHIETSLEPAGQVGFHLLGFVPEPFTLYSNIRALPSGTSVWVERGRNRKHHTFFDARTHLAARNANANRTEIRTQLRGALSSSVRDHLVSDVPIGIFLSSGLDSATVTGLASEFVSSTLNTMTLQFRELSGGPMDEAPLAEKIASLYGTLHQTRTVVGSQFCDELEALFLAMDQPSINGANTYFVAKEAAALGLKVALSGLGGDELFGGYPSFRQIPKLVKSFSWLPGLNRIGKAFRIISSPVVKRLTSAKYAGLFEYAGSYGGAYLLRRGLFMPWELPEVLDPDIAAEGWRKLQLMIRFQETVQGISDDMAKVSALELLWYMRNQLLRDADWAGMAHSLEIRTPLVDSVLFGEVARMNANKQDMAGTLLNPLPKVVLNRPKTGFYLPIREWLLRASPSEPHERGYKGWARTVYKEFAG